MARNLFNTAEMMKTQASESLTRPQFLRMTPSPLLQLFAKHLPHHQDPPAVRAAWLRLYWEIVGKPGRNGHRKP